MQAWSRYVHTAGLRKGGGGGKYVADGGESWKFWKDQIPGVVLIERPLSFSFSFLFLFSTKSDDDKFLLILSLERFITK